MKLINLFCNGYCYISHFFKMTHSQDYSDWSLPQAIHLFQEDLSV